jgi:phospholipid/cholesterol/gamma-HCH transport system ATP-binding protein
MSTVVSLHDIWSRYSDAWIHRGLSLDIAAGTKLALVGGSGSGKTTLLRHMAGLTVPSRGIVRVLGESLHGTGVLSERALRRRIGVLFQHGALFSAFNVFDNIAFPLRELKCLDEAMIQDLVLLKLSLVELLPRHGRLLPSELSGGMVKRVALARALALDPELLLLDEPTAGLDPDRSDSFVRLIRALGSELGLSVVFVTHDLDTLAALASHVAVLADQRIVAQGGLAEVMAVDHPFVQRFFYAERSVRAVRQASATVTEFPSAL